VVALSHPHLHPQDGAYAKENKNFLSTIPGSMVHIKYFERKNWQIALDVLDWAPKSPDLNPIEMLWSILDKKLASKPMYSRAALMDRLQEEWDIIDRDLCVKLVESMHVRIRKCLKAKGGHFL
jgi:hypothetical protein